MLCIFLSFFRTTKSCFVIDYLLGILFYCLLWYWHDWFECIDVFGFVMICVNVGMVFWIVAYCKRWYSIVGLLVNVCSLRLDITIGFDCDFLCLNSYSCLLPLSCSFLLYYFFSYLVRFSILYFSSKSTFTKLWIVYFTFLIPAVHCYFIHDYVVFFVFLSPSVPYYLWFLLVHF